MVAVSDVIHLAKSAFGSTGDKDLDLVGFGVTLALITEGKYISRVAIQDLYSRDRVLMKAVSSYKEVPIGPSVLFTLRPHPLRERMEETTWMPVAICPSALGRDVVLVRD